MEDRDDSSAPPSGPSTASGQPQSGADPLIGCLVAGRYRVVRAVARGGMGRIYLAEQQPLGRPVALKVLDTRYIQSDTDPEFQKRFFLEAATSARLSHPNTVRIIEYGRVDEVGAESYFIAMEFIAGQTLRRVMKQECPMDPARAVFIVIEIARALREAHGMDVVHRDLKPANVMLVPTEEGDRIKVLDFGIAKVMRDDAEDLTSGEKFIGSPRYMAPEQVRHAAIDGRADIYSLGVLLYEMVAGKPPFKGEKSYQTMMAHLNEPVPEILVHAGVRVPAALESVIRRCLEKQPEDRFPDIDALLVGLREVADALGGGGGGDSTTGVSGLRAIQTVDMVPRASGPSDRPLWIVTGVILFAAAALGIYTWVQSRSGPEAGEVVAGAATGDSARVTVGGPPGAESAGGAGRATGLGSVDGPDGSSGQRQPDAEPDAAPVLGVATVHLTSTPEGAEVFDGADALGRTPLDVVVGATPRPLTLRLAGHLPAEITAAPGAEALAVTLERRSRPAGGSKGGAKPRRTPRAPKQPPVGGPDDMEIRTTR